MGYNLITVELLETAIVYSRNTCHPLRNWTIQTTQTKNYSMNITEEKAQLEARLAILSKLENAAKAVAEAEATLLSKLENATKAVDQAKAEHVAKLEAIATENGFKNWAEIEAALAPKVVKRGQRRATVAKAGAPKGKRRRAKIDDEKRAKLIQAYKNRGEKTVADIAKQFGVSEQAVYKSVRAASKK